MIKELVLSTLSEVNQDIKEESSNAGFEIKELFSMNEEGFKLALQIIIHKKNGVEEKVTTKYLPKKVEELESGVEAIYSDVLVEMLKLLL